MLLAMTNMAQARALDKKAENARELGLDYEPVHEPVAWMYEVNGAHTCLDLFEPPDDAYDEGTLHPLYTTPPAQRQWVGLTDEEKQSVCRTGPVYAPNGVVTRTPLQYREELEGVAWTAVRKAEAKLKEKNT
jgi:hypothetical protein